MTMEGPAVDPPEPGFVTRSTPSWVVRWWRRLRNRCPDCGESDIYRSVFIGEEHLRACRKGHTFTDYLRA